MVIYLLKIIVSTWSNLSIFRQFRITVKSFSNSWNLNSFSYGSESIQEIKLIAISNNDEIAVISTKEVSYVLKKAILLKVIHNLDYRCECKQKIIQSTMEKTEISITYYSATSSGIEYSSFHLKWEQMAYISRILEKTIRIRMVSSNLVCSAFDITAEIFFFVGLCWPAHL